MDRSRLLHLAVFALAFSTLGLSSCIKDDIVNDRVEPEVRITNSIDSLALDATYQFSGTYFNEVGATTTADLDWSSSDPTVIEINMDGLATAKALGTAYVRASFENGTVSVHDSILVGVGSTTISSPIEERTGNIVTTSTYLLQGDFTLREDGSNVVLEFADNYRASTSLPGLYIYLTNNPSTTSNALEIGPVEVFSGEHSYTISNTGLNDYSHVLYFCKPFNVKVGDGVIN